MPPKHRLPLDDRYTVVASGCWEWEGCTDPNGYGRMYHPVAKRSYLAHRYFYEKQHGEAPGTLDHTCRNPRCVNPAHLEPISRQENVRRGLRSRLTWEGVRFIRASPLTNKALADMYGVSGSTICNVRAGRIWREE